MLQDFDSVSLTILAPVFQQAVVCDMVCLFVFNYRTLCRAFLSGFAFLQCYIGAFFYVISQQQYTHV